ncbi:MAG: TIGR04282 family arsenosugar biosynthesis glycosyltransferase [bacterium]
MIRGAFCLIAKEPVIGCVKTRLVPPLSHEQAAALYTAFVQDTLARIGEASDGRTDVILVSDPAPRSAPQLAALAHARNVGIRAQSEGDLGQRLFNMFEEGRAEGRAYTIAVGADHPSIPVALLRELLGSMDAGASAAIIPSGDGGYCALGLRAARAEWFANIPWSTPDVLASTVAALRDSGIDARLLGAWYDVDRPRDLDRLAEDIESAARASTEFPRHTAAILSEIGWTTAARRRQTEERIF